MKMYFDTPEGKEILEQAKAEGKVPLINHLSTPKASVEMGTLEEDETKHTQARDPEDINRDIRAAAGLIAALGYLDNSGDSLPEDEAFPAYLMVEHILLQAASELEGLYTKHPRGEV